METWVVVTILAAAIQSLRFALQKRLTGLGLSTGGATFSRFVFAAPLAAAALTGLLLWHHATLPMPPVRFWAFSVIGGLAQIVATLLTVALFSMRAFAVGIAFTKTETLQVAVFSALVLGETVSQTGFAAIVMGVLGVVLLSRPAQGWREGRIINRASVTGIAAGGLFGLSAIGYRGATLEILHPDPVLRALAALAFVTLFQTFAMALWLRFREPGELGRVLRSWRASAPVGLTGVLGSLGWFTAFSLQNAAYVRSVGQIELIFSILLSVLFFRERLRAHEVAGVTLLAVSIVVIVLAA